MNKLCPVCGAETPANFAYCGFCAHPLEAVSEDSTVTLLTTEPVSNLQVVTVLVANLTHIARPAPGESLEVEDSIRQTLQLLSQSITQSGGQIDPTFTDGLLATFGLPQTAEHSAKLALQAALAMQQTLALLRTQADTPSTDARLHIGIHAGPSVPAQPDSENSAINHLASLASRLQSAARPGTILVSELTYRQARSYFSFSEALPLNLRGLTKPILGYEVLGQRLGPQPARGLTNHSTPMVGRAAESDAIVSALQRLQLERQGVSILITGEAGVGKSRLVQEVLAPAAEHLQIVQAECSPTESGSYGLLKALLSAVLGLAPHQTLPERRQQMDSVLGRSATLAREIGPILSDFLEISETPRAPSVDPQQEQRRLFGATRRLIAWLARRQPLALVLDDLQWADQSSLEAISHIVDLILDAPLAMIAIARPVARPTLVPILNLSDPSQTHSFIDIQLSALTATDNERLLSLILSEVALPAALQKSLLDRSAGIPLLLEEITRMLLDEAIIYKTATGWAVKPTWPTVIRQVPNTVNGLILIRYDRLPDHLQHLLDIAAVFKRHFSLVELSAMADAPLTTITAWVRDLELADIFRPVSDSWQARYTFRHPLLREAIYDTISDSQRQALHLKTADVVQQLAGADAPDVIEFIAFHLEQGRSPLARSYLMQSAARASARYANREAINYYQRVQSLSQPPTDARQAVDVALGLGELLVRVNQTEEAREELDKALQWALQPQLNQYRLGDIWYRLAIIQADHGNYPEAVTAFANAATILNTAPETCQTFTVSDIEREMGWNLCNQAQYAEAQIHAARALTEALVQTNQGAVGAAHNLRSVIAYYLGQLQESVAAATQALAIREQLNDVWGSASTQTNLGTLYYKLGQWPTAEAYLRQAIFVQQEIGDHYTLGLSRNTLSLLLLASGRLDEALQLLDQALVSFNAGAEPSPLACMLLMNRGLAHSRLGQAQAALTDLEQSLELATQLNSDNYKTLALAYLAEAHLAQGDPARAHACLAEAITLEHSAPSPGNQAEIARIHSELHQAEADWPRALETNRQAAALYKELGESHEFARSQAAWAGIELSWHTLEPSHAVDPACQAALLEAAGVFKTLRAQADIVATDSLLARLIAVLGTSPASGPETSRPFVVAVYVQLIIPTADQSPNLNLALQALLAALKRMGQEFGAITTANTRELAYIFSTSDRSEADILMLKAVQCAIAARAAAARLNQSNRLKFEVEIPPRIGLSSSLARSFEESSTGSTSVNNVLKLEKRAEALAARAPANHIYLSTEMVSAVGLLYNLEVVAEPDQSQRAPDFYRLGTARSNNALAQKLPGSSNRVVGRAVELSALRGWLDRGKQVTEGQVCYVEAEAGMGKTRLQAEAIAYAQADFTCLIGKCELHRSNISFWAFSNMLADPALAETSASRRLKTVLGLLPPEPEDEVMLQSLSPANLRQELFGRLREFLVQTAAKGPILLIIEDIHWLDLSSLDLLDFLLPILREAPISILLTARAEMAGPHHALLSKAERICGDRYLQIKFSGLAEEDSLALVRQMLDVPTVPRGLTRMIRAYAGHPLSLEESVRHLIESGHLRRADNRWLLTEIGSDSGKELPQTYEDLLLARLENLDSETLHVLQAAATLGETVDQSLLYAIVPGQNLAGALSELVDRGWLMAPEPQNPLLYHFKHTLTRETIHATLLTSKTRILHQRAGEAIENLYPDTLDAQVELLAYHFSRSSQRDKATNYLIRAAEKSAARQALAESLAYYQEAADSLKYNHALQTQLGPRLQLGLADVYLALGIPVSALSVLAELLKASPESLSPDIEGAARQRQAAALRKSGQLNEALTNYEAARELLQRLSTSQLALSASVKATVIHEQLAAHLGLAQTLFDMRENGRAVQQLQAFLTQVDRTHYPDQVAQALDLQGGLLYRLGQPESALKSVQESLAIYQSIGNRAGAAAAYANLGVLSANLNKLDVANDYFAHSLALREALGDMQGLAIIHNNLGQLLVREGRLTEAVSEFSHAGQFARRAGLRQLLTQALSNHGYALGLLGNPQEGLVLLTEAEKLCLSYGFRNLLCETLWKQAECLLEAHDLVEAEGAARNALGQAVDLESNDLQSEARRVLSRLARANGRADLALTEATTAWQARQRDPNAIMRARFAAEYGLALQANQRLAEAQRIIGDHVGSNFAYTSQPYLAQIQQLREAIPQDRPQTLDASRSV